MSYAVKDGDEWYQMNPPDAREGDQHRNSLGTWESCDSYMFPEHEGKRCVSGQCNYERHRLIDPNKDAKPGEKWRILETLETLPKQFEVLYAHHHEWTPYCISFNTPELVKEWITKWKDILAIRVRMEQETGQEICDKGPIKLGASGILFKDGQFLLGKRASNDDQLPGQWCTPGGGVEYGETVNAAIVREFKEETGLTVEVVPGFLNIQEMKHAVIIFKQVRLVSGDLTIGEGFDEVGFESAIETLNITKATRAAIEAFQPPPQPTSVRESEWISVKDKLPKAGEPIWYAYINDAGKEEVWNQFAPADVVDYFNRNRHIHHWMHMAIPPTTTGSDDGWLNFWNGWVKANSNIEMSASEMKTLQYGMKDAWHTAKSEEGV